MSKLHDEFVIFDKQIECRCMAESIRITKWKDEDEYFVSFYCIQPNAPLRYQLWERIKFAISVLLGNDHCFSEIILDKNDMQKLATDIQKHLDEESEAQHE